MNVEQKMEQLKELFGEWKNCTRCALCKPAGRHRQHVVFGDGDPDANVLIIGEAPGENEDITGRPFAGKSGEVFERLLGSCCSNRDEVFTTNVVGCRPTEQEDARQNRKPSKDELKACAPRIHRVIEIVDPYVVILLGQTAMKALTDEKRNITAVARSKSGPALDVVSEGTFIPLVRPGFATFHPAYLLRNWSMETGGDLHRAYSVFQKAFHMADTYAELYHGTTPPQRRKDA